MSDKQTPKSFEEKLKQVADKALNNYGGQYFSVVEYAESKGLRFILEEFWNAATEATRAEYDDKIKAMQAEIDRRDALLSKILSLFNEIDDARYEEVSWSVFNEMDKLQDKIKELNQRGEDE
jgi:hypothetical protein